MKNKMILTLLFAAFFISCHSGRNISKNILSEAFISIEKTPCYGTCPVYSMSIDGDGVALLRAGAFMDEVGFFYSMVQADSVSSLFRHAKVCDWDSYDSTYMNQYLDLPSTIIRFSMNAKDTITVQYNTVNTPEQLKLLGTKLAFLQEKMDWKPVSK
jgi:hypothetical protein|tara:strand:+ start:1009 stop:1479 length:471 start_codon:yes stop_codon:yes gene_type:complete